MAYVRFSAESDIYMYGSCRYEYECCGCRLYPGIWGTDELEEAVAHLEEHKRAGHKVPEWLVSELRKMEQEGVSDGDGV